ncbi:hypothetical protein Q1695_006608 [Nippostrongylus brasiliensis]|nr:hypothetical protein Q1695_006608 [Nippostrongylus brasiliensis]
MKGDYKRVIEKVLRIVRYTTQEDNEPMSWPAMIGANNATFGIRVKVSYQFWQYFKVEGRKFLSEYNRNHGTKIRLLQEKILKQKDRENLCLFIRDAIRKRYRSQGKEPIQMQLRKDQLKIDI